MITNEGLSHDIECLLDILNRLDEGIIKPVFVRRILENAFEQNSNQTVIRGLPEPEVSTNLIEERKRLLGEVYIKLAEIRSNKLAEYRRKEQNINTLGLPTELNTDRAKKYFSLAINEGFISYSNGAYKSNFRTKALLAYFLELVFCYNDNGCDNGAVFPDKALNILFSESRLGKARTQLTNNKNGDGKPKGYEMVDKLFQ